jgi:hypothetical protein
MGMELKEGLRKWRKVLIVISVMILVSPFFAWAAEVVGYAEPLENAAEDLGAMEHEYAILSGLIPDYTVPGADPYASTIVAGIVGCLIVLGLGLVVGRVLERR